MMFLPTPAGITGLIEALAPDLFRLRLERDASAPSPASDAIVERAWETPEIATQRMRRLFLGSSRVLAIE
jgi:hypothetical protein